jgi:hypothetical protein
VERKSAFFTFIILCLIFLLIPLTLFSVDFPADNQDSITVCVFNINDISANQTNLKYEKIIIDILTVELENAGYKLINQFSAQKDKFSLIYGPTAIRMAHDLGAQMVITGFYYVSEQRITINIKCYDVAQKKLITGVLRSGSTGLSIHNLIARILEGMLVGMKALYNVKEASFQEPVIIETGVGDTKKLFMESLTLTSSMEGMQLLLPGQILLGEIKDGLFTTNLPFALNTTLKIEKQKEGYHTGKQKITLKQESQETKIQPINRKNRYGLEVMTTTGQFLGLGLGFCYYLNPDYFFVSAEDYFFAQHTLHPEDQPVFHNDFRLLVGHYLWGPNTRFRMMLSAGIGDVATFFTVPGLRPKNDIYLSLPNIQYEYNLSNWSIYLRQEFKYALGVGPNLLGRKWLFMDNQRKLPILTLGVMRKW